MLRNPQNGNLYCGFLVTDASNASPIVITTSKPHRLTTGTGGVFRIAGVLGNTAANVNDPVAITVLTPYTFSINGSVGNGNYISGGVGWLEPNTAGTTGFGADDFPYVGQWCHSATHFGYAGIGDDTQCIVQYYDGVPVGYQLCPVANVSGLGRKRRRVHWRF